MAEQQPSTSGAGTNKDDMHSPGPLLPLTTFGKQDDDQLVPTVQNMVCTAQLGVQLDLKKITQRARNAEYDPKKFCAVIMRIRSPRTTALVFGNGKLVCTGAKSEEQALLGLRKFARIIQKIDYPEVKLKKFNVENVVGSVDMKFPIRLEQLAVYHHQFITYEPELFPGLVYRLLKPRVCLLVFVSGKIVFTGAKKFSEIVEAFEKIKPIVAIYRKK